MTKTTFAIIIAVAFIAGSITTGSFVYAQLDDNGNPLNEIWKAINNLQSQVGDLESQKSHHVETKVVHLDSSSCVRSSSGNTGWCPGSGSEFLIQDPFLTTKSVITVTYYTPPGPPAGDRMNTGCRVQEGNANIGPNTGFHVLCDNDPEVNSTLNYEITNP